MTNIMRHGSFVSKVRLRKDDEPSSSRDEAALLLLYTALWDLRIPTKKHYMWIPRIFRDSCLKQTYFDGLLDTLVLLGDGLRLLCKDQ